MTEAKKKGKIWDFLIPTPPFPLKITFYCRVYRTKASSYQGRPFKVRAKSAG